MVNKKQATDGLTQIWGRLSLVFGAISLIPFLGILSLAGLLSGIIALITKQTQYAKKGLFLSVIGFVTSPVLWGVVWAMIIGLQCHIDPHHCRKPVSNSAATATHNLFLR